MINIINNRPQNKKLTETFFNLNGRNPSEEEMLTLQENIHFEEEEEDQMDPSTIINNIDHV